MVFSDPSHATSKDVQASGEVTALFYNPHTVARDKKARR